MKIKENEEAVYWLIRVDIPLLSFLLFMDGGAAKLSEIAGKVGEESAVCAAYIKNLISLGIVRKEVPFGEKSSRKTIYVIEDNLFRFWYRFVPENMSAINRNMPEIAYRRMEPCFTDYMGNGW